MPYLFDEESAENANAAVSVIADLLQEFENAKAGQEADWALLSAADGCLAYVIGTVAFTAEFGGLKPFTRQDFFGYAGATDLPCGSPPLIGYGKTGDGCEYTVVIGGDMAEIYYGGEAGDGFTDSLQATLPAAAWRTLFDGFSAYSCDDWRALGFAE